MSGLLCMVPPPSYQDTAMNRLRYLMLPALITGFAADPAAAQTTLAFKAGAGMSRIAFSGVGA